MSARSTTEAPPRRGASARSRIPAGVARRLEELAERDGLPLEALVLAGVAAGAARYGVEPGATLALEGRVRLRAVVPDLAELGRGLVAAARACVEDGASMDTALELELEDDTELVLPAPPRALDATAAASLLDHVPRLLEDAAAVPQAPLAHRSLLTSAEVDRLASRNATARPIGDRPVHELVAEAAVRDPGRPAIVSETETISYGELARRSDGLASRLVEAGAGRGSIVAVLSRRSPAAVAGMLAALKAGAAYLPIDPAYPPARVSFVLGDARPAALLTTEELLPRIGAPRPATFLLEEPVAPPERRPPAAAAGPDDLAYVIYTSGSTGVPKGVGVRHRSLANLVAWHVERYGVGPDDRTTHLAGFGFDATVWEIWPCLAAGATLCVWAGPAVPETFCDDAARLGVTLSFLPTPVLEALLATGATAPRGLRAILTGGDHLRRRPHRGLGARLHNHYGPTEATVLATAGLVEPEGGDDLPPIGGPIPNARVYVLDRAGEPLPDGAVGELHIGGAGVANGYVGRPGMTAERFLPDPFAGVAGARMYATGDLARWRADGTIEFAGRRDTQVKIRGFRIELAEIEAALVEHPQVRECVVVARPDARGDGERRLVGYLVGASLPEVDELREFLAARLPEYMVPAVYVPLERLPLTANGKVDRDALPEPARERPSGAPRTATEEALAALWRELIGLDHVGPDDDFVALGGHSLLATRLAARIERDLGRRVSPSAPLEACTLAALAELVERDGETAGPRPPSRLLRGELAPLSFGQQRLWFLDRLVPGSPLYNVPIVARLRLPLDPEALERALNEIVGRHEALRTVIRRGPEGEPVQHVLRELVLELPREDVRDLPPEGQDAAVDRVLARLSGEPFELDRAPLLRAHLLRVADDEHVLVLCAHHVIVDGWSVGILFTELRRLYEAFAAGRPSPLPELPLQYPDYALWQRTELERSLGPSLAYWRRRLDGAPTVLELPLDRPRPEIQSFSGETVAFAFPAEVLPRLHAFATEEGATPFVVLLAAFAGVLSRASGQKDILLGSAVANRTHTTTEPLIGFFVNTVVLRLELDGTPSFRELVRRARASAFAAYAHQELPFERLVKELNVPRVLAHAPLVQVMLSYDNTVAAELEGDDLEFEHVPLEQGTSRFDLTVLLSGRPGELTGSVEYDSAIFDRATVERLLAQWPAFLDAGLGDPDARLG